MAYLEGKFHEGRDALVCIYRDGLFYGFEKSRVDLGLESCLFGGCHRILRWLQWLCDLVGWLRSGFNLCPGPRGHHSFPIRLHCSCNVRICLVVILENEQCASG